MDIIHAHLYAISAGIVLMNMCVTAGVLWHNTRTRPMRKHHAAIYTTLACVQIALGCAFHMYWFSEVATSTAAHAELQRFTTCALMLVAIAPAIGQTLYLNDYTQQYPRFITPRHTGRAHTQSPFHPQRYFGEFAG